MSEQAPNGRGNLLGWCCAYAVTAFLFIFAVANGYFESFCEPSGPTWLPWSTSYDKCVRDWLTAIAGPAALILGMLNLFLLSRQVREAASHYQDMAKIELRRTRAMAKKAKRHTEETLRICNTFQSLGEAYVHVTDTPNQADRQEILNAFHQLLARCTNPLFQRVEDEIDAPEHRSITSVISTLETIIEQLTAMQFNQPTGHYWGTVLSQVANVRTYASSTASAVDAFLSDTDRTIGAA